MDEDGKKHSSLPSNYVTLVQLQGRWLEEKQRKQQEKEEEERKHREKEEQQRKHEDQENQKRRNENKDRNNTNAVPRRPSSCYRRSPAERNFKTVGASHRKPEDMRIGAIVVVDGDGERKADDSIKRMSKGERKPRAEEGQIGSTEQLLLENKAEGKIPVVVTQKNGAKEISSEIRRNGKNLVVNGRAWEKKVTVDRSVEIGRKFGNISLSGGRGGYGRPSGRIHGGYWNYNRDSEKFKFSKPQKPKGSNMVWVRKGDTSDINVA